MIKLNENINVGQTKYKLKGMVRSFYRHFTCAVLIQGKWVYIDYLCSGVEEFTNLAALKKRFEQGWFFTKYELSNMGCEPQSCEPDNENVEASMEFTEIPIKKRRWMSKLKYP